MPAAVALSQLVDLALGSPEVGAVNFNVLHTLLHAMIQKLNIQDVKADIDEHDRELLSSHGVPRAFSAFSADSGYSKGEDSFSLSEDNISEKSSYAAPHKKSPYHRLEKQVSELTKQMEELNKLPSNEELLGKTKGKESERPISDMWQYMQLKNRVDANEKGVGKLMSLMEDLMKEMNDLKESQKALMDKVAKINLDDVYKRLNDMDSLFKDLEDKYKTLDDKVGSMPTFDDVDQFLSGFVTWPGLEDALKGVRLDFENMQPISEERVVIELGTQTDTPKNRTPDLREGKKRYSPDHDESQVEENQKNRASSQIEFQNTQSSSDILSFGDEPKSRPTSARPASRASSVHSTGPSSELLDILERLGKLATAHGELQKRVAELERLMELKANKGDLEGLGGADVPEDLLQTLSTLQEELKALQETQFKDAKASKITEASGLNLPSPPPNHNNIHTLSVSNNNNNNHPLSLSEHRFEDIVSPSPLCISPEDLVSLPNLEMSPTSSACSLESYNQPASPWQQLPKQAKPLSCQSSSQNVDISSSHNNLDISSATASITSHPSNNDLDGAAIKRLQDALQKLQRDLENLRGAMDNLSSENTERIKEIKDLNDTCSNLDKNKADKQYVDMEVDVKADRRSLEGKVNHSLFDTTTNELNRMIKDILDKLNGHEEGWKSALAKAMEELDGKLDRMELRNLKDWLEKQLKSINNKIKTMGPGYQLDDEAAGMKKQLIQRFNCLSCDKPVDIMPHGPIPSIPGNYALPRSKSPRPYTTFELDQIRQHARRIYNGMNKSAGSGMIRHDRCLPFSMDSYRQQRNRLEPIERPKTITPIEEDLGMNPELADYYNQARQCGGNHTLTYPNKRTTKLNNLGQVFREEETILPIYKDEIDVQGADGHIYKGRMESARLEAKLPVNLTTKHSHPVYMQPKAPSPQPPQRPLSARVPRPSSARPDSSNSQRAQSAMPSAADGSVPVPQNSQIGGSRATTPLQEEVVTEVAVEVVAVENQVQEQEGVDQQDERAGQEEEVGEEPGN